MAFTLEWELVVFLFVKSQTLYIVLLWAFTTPPTILAAGLALDLIEDCFIGLANAK